MRKTPFKFEWWECRGDLPTIDHKITVSLDEADEFIGMRGVNHRNSMNKLSPEEICRRMDLCRETNIKYKEMTGYDRSIVYTHLCDKWSYLAPIIKEKKTTIVKIAPHKKHPKPVNKRIRLKTASLDIPRTP